MLKSLLYLLSIFCDQTDH